MKFNATALDGVWIIEPDRHEDERGWFARTHCAESFRARGLTSEFSQCSTSFNRQRGTLRGLHYQAAGAAEAKLIRCARGAVFDVAVDLRPGSATLGRWISVTLSAGNGAAIHIPKGCAHGFQTLEPDTELFYQISVPYQPALARGVRWDDPALAIAWPLERPILSERDRALPTLTPPVPATKVNELETLGADHG